VWLLCIISIPNIRKHKDFKKPCIEKKKILSSNSFKKINKYIKEQLDIVEKAKIFFTSVCVNEMRENSNIEEQIKIRFIRKKCFDKKKKLKNLKYK
jgi:hypothetical protein